MSLKLNERYPGRFDNPSADYPQGAFKNRTTPDARDGSYLEKDWANDKEGFFQSLLKGAGVVPNGQVDKVGGSQAYDALLQTISSAAGGTPPATESVAGIIRIATDTEVDAGTSDDSAITPLKLRNKSQSSKTDDSPGTLLLTGAYGMGGGGIFLPVGTDLDSIVGYGVYRITGGLNIPEGFDHSTMHVMVGSDIVTQMVINLYGGMATRALAVGAPEGWRQWNIQWGSANFNPETLSGFPIGVPVPWPTVDMPAGCLAMNGQAFDPGLFPRLAALYPSHTLPDMRGLTIRALDAGRGIDVGRVVLSAQDDALQNMTGKFTLQEDDSTLLVNSATGVFTGGDSLYAATPTAPSATLTGLRSVIFNMSAVARVAEETRVKNIAYNYVCRAL